MDPLVRKDIMLCFLPWFLIEGGTKASPAVTISESECSLTALFMICLWLVFFLLELLRQDEFYRTYALPGPEF